MGLLRSLLRDTIREAIAADSLAPAPPPLAREPGAHKLGDLTLERHHAAVAADLSAIRGDLHNLAEDIREMRQRSEQVFSWLANLQGDLHRVMKEGAGAAMEGLAARRQLIRSAGRPLVNTAVEGVVHPLSPTDGEET